MPENIIPLHKLYIFREKIGIEAPDLSALAPFRHLFLERKEEFSDYFYNVFGEYRPQEPFWRVKKPRAF